MPLPTMGWLHALLHTQPRKLYSRVLRLVLLLFDLPNAGCKCWKNYFNKSFSDEKSSDSTEENRSQSDKKIQDVKRKKAKKRKANDHDGKKDEIDGKKKLKKVPKIDETLVKSDEEKPKKKKKKKRARVMKWYYLAHV